MKKLITYLIVIMLTIGLNAQNCVTTFPHTEDFQSQSCPEMTLTAEPDAASTIDDYYTYHWQWHGTGRDGSGNYNFDLEEDLIFTYSNQHVATGALCVDLSNVTSGSAVKLTFDLYQTSDDDNLTNAWFRVKVQNDILSNDIGKTYFHPHTACLDPWETQTYDLSAYVGMNIDVEFQSCANRAQQYFNGLTHCGDNSFIDDINIEIITSPVYGCTNANANNYNINADMDDGTCTYDCIDANGYFNGFEIGFENSSNQMPFDWYQSKTDNVSLPYSQDWIWNSWGTGGNLNYGPESANNSTNYHSYEMIYYMYANGNSSNADCALISHCFDVSTISNPEFKFWYNMYSNGTQGTMGTLDVYLSGDGGVTWNLAWTKSGNQGSDWYEAVIDVSAYTNTGVTIKLDAFSASSASDICIDALSFNAGTAPTPSWDCVNNACVDPQDGNGIYTTLSACQANCDVISIEENNKHKTLVKIVDVLGKEIKPKEVIGNTTLFYIYDDGTVEKQIIIE